MATTQQHPAVFAIAEAERFAALMAGFDTGNSSEAEAIGKGRALRRMLVEKKIRLVDALELPEIRKALDDQMQPVRLPVPDVAALQTENERLRKKLAFVVPRLRKVSEALAEEWKWDRIFTKGFFLTSTAFSVVCVVVGTIYDFGWGFITFTAADAVGSAVCFFIFKGDRFGRQLMNYLELVKQKALLCYAWAAHIFFGLNALMYIACCIVAGGPVGPIAYITWLYHCCQWKVS